MRRCSASREAESIYQEAQYLLFRGLGAVYPRFLGLLNSVEVNSLPPRRFCAPGSKGNPHERKRTLDLAWISGDGLPGLRALMARCRAGRIKRSTSGSSRAQCGEAREARWDQRPSRA